MSEDEVLDGYLLKKGTVVFGNVWYEPSRSLGSLPHVTYRLAFTSHSRTLMHDENYFSMPYEFIPERHLPEGQSIGATALLDPVKYIFGFGRRLVSISLVRYSCSIVDRDSHPRTTTRICPGQELALRETWLAIACTLATLKIEKPVDDQGKVIEPVIDVLPGSIR